MNIMDELEQHDIDTKELGDKLGEDTCKKIGAILNILEIGNESIAHAFWKFNGCNMDKEKFEEFKEKGAILIPSSDSGGNIDVDLIVKELNQGKRNI